MRVWVQWDEIVDLLRIDGGEIDTMNLQINTVRDNTEIIRRSDNWLKLAFLESLCIKDYAPELNSGIKSCMSYLCLDDVKTIWRQLRKRKPLQSLYND